MPLRYNWGDNKIRMGWFTVTVAKGKEGLNACYIYKRIKENIKKKVNYIYHPEERKPAMFKGKVRFISPQCTREFKKW